MKKLLLLCFLPFVFSFTMCGNRGDPLPPLQFSPETPEISGIDQVYRNLLVKWQPVKKFSDGRKLANPEEIYYIVSVNFGKEKAKIKNTYFLDSKVVSEGEKRCYTITAVYRGKYFSQPSEPFCAVARKPIEEIPEILSYVAGDGFVKFEFKPITDYSIEVFKNSSLHISPYKTLPPKTSEFVDKNVVNGKEYSYSFRFSEGNLKGRFSKTYNLTPEDRTPPEPPANVFLIRKGNSCTILWDPSPSEDVSGYVILKREKVVGSTGRGIYFLLPNCPKGSYYVKAVDKAGNFSKPTKAEEVINEEGSSDNGK
ncbi:hypothetical protein [Desulfurobacterium crinifex]